MSLVPIIIEFGNIIWMPFYDADKNRIESLQKQFLLFCLRGLGWSHPFILPPYTHRLNLLNMLTLNDRQTLACCVFVFDVLRGDIKSPFLLSAFQVREHRYNFRNARCLTQETPRTNYIANSPIYRCRELFNMFCSNMDLTVSKSTFKLE